MVYRLEEIIQAGPGKVRFHNWRNWITNLFTLDETKFSRFMKEFNELLENMITLLFDMGAGIQMVR